MDDDYQKSLAALREFLKQNEDWVSVGYIEYILDRISEYHKLANLNLLRRCISSAIH